MTPPNPLPDARPAAILLVLLLACGALSLASARAQDAVPDHALGAAAWPGLPQAEQAMIEAVAREVWAEGGHAPARYDRLPEARKAALRGTAMRRLGLRQEDVVRGWV